MVTNFDVGDDLPLLVYLSSNSLVILKEKVCQHEWKKRLKLNVKFFQQRWQRPRPRMIRLIP